MIASSVINLYDAVSQTVHYQQKVSSDRVILASNSAPLDLKAPSVNIVNNDGTSVTDVVATMLATILSVSQEASDRAAAVSLEASTRAQSDADLQTALNQEHADMLADVLTEKTRGLAAELVLRNDLVVEVSARASAITSEIASRASGDQTLTTNLTQEIQDRINAVLVEASARAAGLASELSARASADATLQANIDYEIAERIAEDDNNLNFIMQEQSDRIAAVSAEAGFRVAGDALVQTNLNTEASTRLNNDTTLQTNITAEQTSRIAAISAEALARSNADETLATSILTEKNRALAEVLVERLRIDSLLAGTSIDLNQLQELINAYSTADSSILTTIGLIQSNIAAIQAQLTGTDSRLNSLIEDISLLSTAIAIAIPQLNANLSTIDGVTYTLESSVYGPAGADTFPAWFAFNDTKYCWDSNGLSDVQNGVTGNYLKLQMSKSAIVSSYKFGGDTINGETPLRWVLYHSIDGSNWTIASDKRDADQVWDTSGPKPSTALMPFTSVEAKYLLLIITKVTSGLNSCVRKLEFA